MKIERLKGERNHRQALREIDSLIESFPEEMKLYTERYFHLDKLGRESEALQAIEKAIQLDPSDSKNYYFKAKTLLNMKQLNDAKSALENCKITN